MKFKIHKGSEQELDPNDPDVAIGPIVHHYYFTIVGRNGEIVATSQMYKRKQSARRAIISIIAGVGGSVTADSMTVDETGES